MGVSGLNFLLCFFNKKNFSFLPLFKLLNLNKNNLNSIFKNFVLKTECKSIIAVGFFFLNSLNRAHNPKIPLCLFIFSNAIKLILLNSLKRPKNFSSVTIVNLTSEYYIKKHLIMGIIIATSPKAEKRSIKICSAFFNLFFFCFI